MGCQACCGVRFTSLRGSPPPPRTSGKLVHRFRTSCGPVADHSPIHLTVGEKRGRRPLFGVPQGPRPGSLREPGSSNPGLLGALGHALFRVGPPGALGRVSAGSPGKGCPRSQGCHLPGVPSPTPLPSPVGDPRRQWRSHMKLEQELEILGEEDFFQDRGTMGGEVHMEFFFSITLSSDISPSASITVHFC